MDPTQNSANYKLGIFYYNADDPRLIVPKRRPGLGYTMNLAHPVSYGVLVLLFSILLFVGHMIDR